MNALKTTFLLGLMTTLFVLVGSVIGGESGMIVAFVFAMVLNMGSYWFSDKIVLAVYKAKPADEKHHAVLFRQVRLITQRAGLPMPKVYVIPNDTPNAFATGRNPEHAAVACTTGLLGLLNEKELGGVVAHELGHVKNRDILVGCIAATIAGAVMMLANMARWTAFFGGGNSSNNRNPYATIAALLIMSVLAPLAAVLIQSAISRSREFGADEAGARFAGDPLALASALKKLEAGVQARPLKGGATVTAHLFIVKPFRAKGVANLFSTHPPTAERVKRLEALVGRL